MTAKRKARGTVSRLEALEDTAAQRQAAVETAKEETWARVFNRMARADVEAIAAGDDCQEQSGPQWAEVRRLMTLATGPRLPHPVSEAAWDWHARYTKTPEGQPWPVPADPSSFAAYFEAEAARADAVGTWYMLAPALLTGARWMAAWWRLNAVLVLDMGRWQWGEA
ncbi:hypothetical protein [Deinococcus frigens]|uniref:hypothetical protein n=1 Tax=Deinococcus frigens TaxID=249403 RepID=UPI000495A35C|nr:hypothetical protein [Deinococcus frigens]